MQSDTYNTQGENFYRLNLDYNYQFNMQFSMNFAYGTIIDNYHLHQDNQTLKQNQIRSRPSIYLSYSPFNKLNMKIGGAVEFFHQNYQDVSQSQMALLPFVNIQYRPIDKFSVTAKYHSWATYPDIGQLSPFIAQMDTLTWSVGNPDLEMSNYNEISLDFNILQHFTITPFYVFDNSNIQQYLREENSQYFQSSVNADKFKIYGLRVSFMYPFLKTLFWQNYLNLEDVNLSYNKASSQHTRFQLGSSLYYSIPKWNSMVGVGLNKFITKNPLLQGYNTWGTDVLFLMFQKSFFKNRLNCSLLYAPPINFLQYTKDTYTQAGTYEASSRFRVDAMKNMLMLQINYRFNTGKQINIQNSSLNNETTAPIKKGGGIL